MTQREKKKNKKIIYTVIVVVLYICTFLLVLMWVFFGLKCAKLSTFNLYFATTDVVALMGLSMRLDTIYFIKN